MPWGFAIAAGGTLLSGYLTSQSAGQAANAQTQSSQQAIQEQQREFNIGQQNQAPWLQVGSGALNQLATLYGIAPYTGPTPGTGAGAGAGTGTAANSNLTPGMLAAQQSGPHSQQGFLGGNGIAAPLDSFGGLFFGKKNATPIQDIAGALAAGHPVKDSDWAKAGYGPGGSLTAGQNDPLTGKPYVAPTPSPTTGPTLAQANPTTPGGNGVPQGPVADVQANGSPNTANFWQSPDYQFRMQQGLAGVDAGAAARGSLDSGATRKAEINYSGNLAAGDYNNYANRLAALAGVGQTTATNTANQGQAYATAVGNQLNNQGDALASSYVTKGANYGTAIGDLSRLGQGLVQNNPQWFGSTPSGGTTYNPGTGSWALSPGGF